MRQISLNSKCYNLSWVREMIIYVDVLIFTNFIIDLLLLLFCSKLTNRQTTKKRLIAAAFVLSLFSLIIFLPNYNIFVQLILRIIPSILGVLICFKYKTLKLFLLDVFVLFSVTFCFAGLILGLNLLISSDRISVNNGAVYFDISPLVLITSAFIFYIIILIYKKVKANNLVESKKVELELYYIGTYAKVKALVDSGHSLTDMLTDSEVIIIDLKTASELLGQSEANYVVEHLMPLNNENTERFRAIPVKTVSGNSILPAIRLDSMTVIDNSEKKLYKNTIAAIMKDTFGGDYSAIISEQIIKN